MNNPEEGYARDIERKLTALLACDDNAPTITVSWREMCWKCVVERGENLCYISCNNQDDKPYYHISFRRQAKRAADGYTESQADILASVVEWTNGASLPSLYEHFEYVDAIKRANQHVTRKYIEEEHAKHLHAELTARFSHDESTAIIIKGRGVHWKCVAQRAQNSCSISCFDHKEAAQYFIYLERDSLKIATGRSDFIEEIINVVADWLQDTPLPIIYDRFAFIDESKRRLLRTQQEIIALVPRLNEWTDFTSHRIYSDSYELLFTQGERTCRCFGRRTSFRWGKSELFECTAETIEAIAKPIERWVCDQAMPSALRSEFPWIETGELAEYYERGEGWEGECLQSWDKMEAYYRDPYFNRVPYEEMLNLIAQMRAKGYDKTLRAGQSMWTFVLSRSRAHGLRSEQPNLRINFIQQDNQDMILHINVNCGPPLTFETTNLTPEIETLLRELATQEID